MNKELFETYTHQLLHNEKPSDYFNELKEFEDYPKNLTISYLFKLDQIPQNKKYHPEGHVWNHVMMVVDNAAKLKSASRDPKAFMWGALLHDIGKLTTTKVRKGRITSYDHDKEGKNLAKKALEELTDDETFITTVMPLVRWHMQPLFVNKNLPFQDLRTMVNEVVPTEIGLLSLCDRLGRGELKDITKEEELKGIISFLKACIKYSKNRDELEDLIENMDKGML